MFATNTGRNSESIAENEEREAGIGGFNQEQKPFEQKLEQLMQTLSRMKIFIKRINELQIKIENNIIYNFCDLYQKPPLSSDVIVPLLDKRIERMMKNRRLKKNWSQEDLQILVWTVNHFASLNNIDKIQKMTDFHWKSIASLIPGTTGQSCMFKILSLRKIRLSEENWSQLQSNLLFQIVRDFQFVDWKIASQELFKRNRSQSKIFRNAKQCKQHWNCYLNPNLKKGPWSVQQDIILIQYIIENSGRKKWTQIAKIFSGRTENALKNRYNLLIERYRLGEEGQRQRYELKMLGSILDDLLQKRMRCREYVDNNKTKDEFRSKEISNTPNSPHTTHSFDVETKSGLVKSPKKIQLKAQTIPEMLKQQTIIVNNGTQKPEIKPQLTIEVPESNVVNQNTNANVNLNANVGLASETGQEWSGDAVYPVFYNGYGFWVFFNQNYP